MLQQLRLKLVAVIMLVSTLLLCILLSLVYQFTAMNLEAENIRMMQSVNDSVGPGGFRPDASQPDDRLHYFVLSRNLHGDLLVIGNTSFDLNDSELLLELYNTAAADPDDAGELKQYSLRYCRLMNAWGIAYVFSDISDEIATLKTLRNGCILIELTAIILMLIISILLVRWIVRPVEQSWEQQKQFIGDASHELKTPLTVIMTNVEMLESPDYTDSQKQELVRNISSMTARMRSLVEGLLDLARVDSGALKNSFQSVDYSDLVEQSLLPFEPLYFESGRMLESDITPNIELTGSPGHLSQVTDILLDNALKYSYEGSTVRLTLHQQGKFALLCVNSLGDAISPEDLENIFRRFYTVDKARTGDSYGLGLSIADAIIREHNGKIWAESANGHNQFFVRLPI